MSKTITIRTICDGDRFGRVTRGSRVDCYEYYSDGDLFGWIERDLPGWTVWYVEDREARMSNAVEITAASVALAINVNLRTARKLLLATQDNS